MPSIEEYIRKNHLTLAQFASMVGVQRSHVSKLIAGDRVPSLPLLRKIHEVTGVPVKVLLYECT
jgi:transcriptional regulator with XRE-family HTH domain